MFNILKKTTKNAVQPVFKILKKSSKKAGLPPGTLVHIGEKKVEQTRIAIIDYDEEQLVVKEVQSIEECFPFKDKSTVTWINIDGLHDVDPIEKLGTHFDIHPLILEDIVHTGQRPKVEDFENYVYFVLMMLYYDDESNEIIEEQFSIILGKNIVITFQEKVGDVFKTIRERIHNKKLRIRKAKAPFLAYRLIDTVVDNYFLVLEKLEDKIEHLEEELLMNPTKETLQSIYDLRRRLLSLRKSIWPLRDVINSIEKDDVSFFDETMWIFFRDIYDHVHQVIETIEIFREIISNMLDTYLTAVSNRMNEVMKVLTIIATIFIPLTFVAGIYGMNFKYMPELEWKWGYASVLILMAVIVCCMFVYFRKKKWL
jgi:magnesium transporter